MVLSIEQLKAMEPRRYCSECDKTKPISQFPVKNNGLKTRPGKICCDCQEKHKQPKIEAEILGVSESKSLLKDLNIVKDVDDMYEDEDEERTKECTQCREFKPLDEFDRDDKICEECLEEMEEEKKRLERLRIEKEDKEETHKKCTVCGKEKTLKRFGFDSETNKIKDVCKLCEVHIKQGPEKIKSKFCTRCKTEKPISDFYMKKGKTGDKLSDYEMPCKKCKNEVAKDRRDKKRDYVNTEVDKTLQAKESTEKRAMQLLNEHSAFMKRYKITVKLLVEKFGFAKSTAANYMRILVDKGLFKEQGRGNGRSWSYIGDDKPSSKPVSKAEKILEEATMENKFEVKSVSEEDKPHKCGPCVPGNPKMPEETSVDLQTYDDKIDKLVKEIETLKAKGPGKLEILKMDKGESDSEFSDLLEKMWQIRSMKRQDYNAGSMNNFELTSKLLGIDSHVGILVRMSDKLSRLGSFTQKGFNAVNDESVEDTLLDLVNYSLLCIIEYRKKKGLSENGI